MDLVEAVLESWDRQVRIIGNIADLVTPELEGVRSREGEWPMKEHLCHIHIVRRGWLEEVAPEAAKELPKLYTVKGEDQYELCGDLAAIRAGLNQSAHVLREVVAGLLADPRPVGPYSHPLFFLQHMVWHEGWHASSLMLALRSVGKEPSEEWEEENIWAIWRS